MTDTAKPKYDRSPVYPFISLRKAEERAKSLWQKHRREAARIGSVGTTWGYGAKSSGLQQTVGALKQYGLIDVTGSGDERKIQLTDLGMRLVADQRAGAREAALKEAALRPRLFQEYQRWFEDTPSTQHCLSELELDRGFNPLAARIFLNSLLETAKVAGLYQTGAVENFAPPEEDQEEGRADGETLTPTPVSKDNEDAEPKKRFTWASAGGGDRSREEPEPTSLKVEIRGDRIIVFAALRSGEDVSKLIRILEANKVLLEEE